MRLAWPEFHPWLEEYHPQAMVQSNLAIKDTPDIKELYEDTCHGSMSRVLLNP